MFQDILRGVVARSTVAPPYRSPQQRPAYIKPGRPIAAPIMAMPASGVSPNIDVAGLLQQIAAGEVSPDSATDFFPTLGSRLQSGLGRALGKDVRAPSARASAEIAALGEIDTLKKEAQVAAILERANPEAAIAYNQARAVARQENERIRQEAAARTGQAQQAILAVLRSNLPEGQKQAIITGINSGVISLEKAYETLGDYSATSAFTPEYRSWLASRGGDYTAEGNDYTSFLRETENIEDDERLSTYGRILVESGIEKDSPEFQERMNAYGVSLVQMQKGEETLTPIEQITFLSDNMQKIPSYEAVRTVLSTIPSVKAELNLATAQGNGQAFITATRRLSDLAQGSSRAQSEMEEFRERNNIVGAFSEWVETRVRASGGVPTTEFMNRLNTLADTMQTQAIAESERQLSQLRRLYSGLVSEDVLASFEASQRLAYNPEQSTEDLVMKYLGESPNFDVNFNATLTP